MQTIELPSWAGFHKTIAAIKANWARHTVELDDGSTHLVENEVLFRGQSNSSWALETTLERTTSKRYSIQQYLQRGDSVVNEIESVTGAKWHLPSYPQMREQVSTIGDSLRAYLPCYEYLVYLRHHGFPSPLLDWTRSPFIAAYFALEQQNNADRCAVFAFVERPEGGKMLKEGDVMITSMGPYITTHARHFAQKASYTIATKWDRDEKAHYFSQHQAVEPSEISAQDILIKMTIPRVDRIAVLKELDEYNINHYTLFHTEDALVRSLGLRVFELEGADGWERVTKGASTNAADD